MVLSGELAGFAGLALTLALAGLYGLLSQSVARRTHDIGIRIALGANRAHVLRSVLGQACFLAILGIFIGTAAAAAAIRLAQGMLYSVTPPTEPSRFPSPQQPC